MNHLVEFLSSYGWALAGGGLVVWMVWQMMPKRDWRKRSSVHEDPFPGLTPSDDLFLGAESLVPHVGGPEKKP